MARVIGSSLEQRIYNALLAVGWRRDAIEIQTPILGGRSTKGGQVLDFVVYRPTPVPICANGEYFHRDDGVEFIKTAQVMEQYGIMPVIIWGEEAQTPDQAEAVVLARVGRP